MGEPAGPWYELEADAWPEIRDLCCSGCSANYRRGEGLTHKGWCFSTDLNYMRAVFNGLSSVERAMLGGHHQKHPYMCPICVKERKITIVSLAKANVLSVGPRTRSRGKTKSVMGTSHAGKATLVADVKKTRMRGLNWKKRAGHEPKSTSRTIEKRERTRTKPNSATPTRSSRRHGVVTRGLQRSLSNSGALVKTSERETRKK